jgi:hypothetical protein
VVDALKAPSTMKHVRRGFVRRLLVLALALTLVLSIAGAASAGSAYPTFTKREASFNGYFGSLNLHFVEKGLQPHATTRTSISSMQRMIFECHTPDPDFTWTGQKRVDTDFFAWKVPGEANRNGIYRYVSGDIGPVFQAGGEVKGPESCPAGEQYLLRRVCYWAITVIDLIHEGGVSRDGIGFVIPDKICGRVQFPDG